MDDFARRRAELLPEILDQCRNVETRLRAMGAVGTSFLNLAVSLDLPHDLKMKLTALGKIRNTFVHDSNRLNLEQLERFSEQLATIIGQLDDYYEHEKTEHFNTPLPSQNDDADYDVISRRNTSSHFEGIPDHLMNKEPSQEEKDLEKTHLYAHILYYGAFVVVALIIIRMVIKAYF